MQSTNWYRRIKGGNALSKLNRFRWISSVLVLMITILGAIGVVLRMYVLEAVCIVALFVDFFLIIIKNRCPDCKRSLPLHPPLLLEEEYCKACGSKIK